MSGQGALELPIPAADIAAATLARHRRMCVRNGINPAVVNAPAYRAMVARALPYDVARHVVSGASPDAPVNR